MRLTPKTNYGSIPLLPTVACLLKNKQNHTTSSNIEYNFTQLHATFNTTYFNISKTVMASRQSLPQQEDVRCHHYKNV